MIDRFTLQGKTAFISGSSRGLGFTYARGLAEAGARVIINGFHPEGVTRAVDTLTREGFSCSGYAFDIADEAQDRENIRKMIIDEKHIDILINNAGIQKRFPLEEFPYADWKRVMDINLHAPFLLSQLIAENMISRKSGKIINICSLTSEAARKTISAYTTSKGGIKMLTKALAVELGPYNIQVNGLSPGYVATEMNTNLLKNKDFNSWIIQRTPAGRWSNPDDLMGPVIFLSSPASDFVNGQIIYVDGGFLANLGGP